MGSRVQEAGRFFWLLLELGDFRTGVLELDLGLLEVLDLLLGSKGSFLPALPTEREIAAPDLSFLEFAFAASRLVLSLVPALHQFGNENMRWSAECGGRVL